MTAPSRDHGAADLNAAQRALDDLARERAAAPSPDDLRAQLAAVTAERDAAIARAEADEVALRVVALWLGGPHQSPQPDDVAALARTKGAELDALRAIIEGRAKPPTIAEARAHCHGTRGAFVAKLGDGNAHCCSRVVTGLQRFPASPQRWIALDANGRPCAWPTVPA